MTKFKVGDKVRILNANAIKYGSKFWRNGDITKVTRIEPELGVYLATPCDDNEGLYVTKAECRYIEKLPQNPTKNQRITTLESEVAELKAKVEALEKAQIPTSYKIGVDFARTDADITKVASQLTKLIEGETVVPRKKMSLTPNEQRKAIIAEAKAFIEDAQKRDYRIGSTPAITSYLKSVFFGYTDELVFHVNAEKRTVVAIIRTKGRGNVVLKGIAKCAPDDVFNADIGKAIALGRALGLDVSKFEQAVKPTEVVAGMRVQSIERHTNRVRFTHMVMEAENKAHITRALTGDDGYSYAKIIDDTEAQY